MNAAKMLRVYNAVRDPDRGHLIGWEPRLYREFDPTHRVPTIVELHAGPFNW